MNTLTTTKAIDVLKNIHYEFNEDIRMCFHLYNVIKITTDYLLDILDFAEKNYFPNEKYKSLRDLSLSSSKEDKDLFFDYMIDLSKLWNFS